MNEQTAHSRSLNTEADKERDQQTQSTDEYLNEQYRIAKEKRVHTIQSKKCKITFRFLPE